MPTNVVTAVDLWDRLVTGEMVRPKDYDSDLVEELRVRLKLSGTDFRKALDDAELSAEDLIRPFLSMVVPVTAMMGDLLSLYENIAARRTRDENIRFSFNFDADAEPLDIDLTAFREFERRWRQATRPRRFVRWDQSHAWEMVEVVNQLLPERAALGEFAYDEWTDPHQPCPESGLSSVDEILGAIWELRSGFLSEAMLLWPNRADHRQGFSHNSDIRTPDMLTEVWGDRSNEIRHYLASMADDYWDRSVDAATTAVAERSRSDPPSTEMIAEVAQQLNELVATLPAVQRDVEQQVEDLEELLSLPVWGKRHEVYSAWVFTQIVAAIGFEKLSFHVCDGRLSFDFSGAHLASFDTVEGPVRVWAELRTRYDNPVGKGRSGAIQPDYSLSHDPVHEPVTTLLAVECKQYKRSALRTHADALIDYTGGLPNASVVLAAYGPVSAGVLPSVEPTAGDRARVISHLRPGNNHELRRFHSVVSRTIPALLQTPADSPRSARTPERVTEFTLVWQAPVDLDLHAEVVDGSGTVCYSTQRVALADGYVQLDRDALAGPATETITVATAQRVHIWVHAFGQGTSLADADARIRITSGSTEIVIPIGKQSDGADADRWFDVCVVQNHQVEIVGRLSTQGP